MSDNRRKKRPKQKKEDASDNYVDNKELLAEMIEWKKEYTAALESEKESTPPIPESVGEKIMLIAEGVARMNNFSGYTYRDEMILDGIENCIRYAHNFDPEKSSNPFSYFSTMIYYAFVRRIGIEKKQSSIKKKCIELAIDDPRYQHDLGSFGTSAGALSEMQKKLSGETAAYEESVRNSRKSKKKTKQSSSSSSSGSSILF